MVVSEEIEALEAQAIDPIRFLVVPRVIATTVMMVCIAVVGDIAGAVGGLIVGSTFLGISQTLYIEHTFQAIHPRDFITGLVKSAVFGMLISGLACRLGLSVTGGAQGVGIATTRTVVLTIVALITVDLIFTSVFFYLGPIKWNPFFSSFIIHNSEFRMSSNAIQVQSATKIYDGRTILDAIRLDVFDGETLVILGGSGSGKSTLLRMMIGNARCDGGDIVAFGKSLKTMSDDEID